MALLARVGIAAWLALSGALLAPGEALAQGAPDDAARATFLLVLGKYVTWPVGAFKSPTAPIVVAVVGNAGLVAELESLARGQQIEGRGIEIRAASDPAACASAHIVFVSDAAQSSALASAQPLRVFEGPRHLADTDIAIRMQAGRIAFSVNRKDVTRRGIKLSSKLMRLASSFE